MTIIVIPRALDRYNPMSDWDEIQSWLESHVGELTERFSLESWPCGNGWELRSVFDPATGRSWCVEIDDEQLAVLFKLRWA